jgi:pimeloyl-ACP methyl ester carboxylesterase
VKEQTSVETMLGSLAVDVHGDGVGPVAVLWNSLFVDDRSWARVAAELSSDRRLVIITGPGHGASGDPGRRYTLEDCAEAAATVLDSLGVVEPVDWVGNAWGGHVGIVFATMWPARCRTLTTFGAPVQALRAAERVRTTVLLLAYRLIGMAPFIRTAVVSTLLSAKTRAQDPAAVELVEQSLNDALPGPLRNAIVSISLHRPDLTPLLAGISTPALFVTGSEHQGWTPAQAAAASRLMPDCSSSVIADAAYLVPLEAPTGAVKALRGFWSTHRPTTEQIS